MQKFSQKIHTNIISCQIRRLDNAERYHGISKVVTSKIFEHLSIFNFFAVILGRLLYGSVLARIE